MNKKNLEELENLLCLKGKTLFLGIDLKGIFFEMDDFKQLLQVFGELQRSADNNELS